jgi:glycerol-3-phosphate dehydrogenase
VPREYLIDPWSAPLAYALQAVAHGATVLRSCEVTGGAFDGALWRLETTRGRSGRLVVNAAGLWGDMLDDRLLGRRDFTIRPRKGQFVVYDKPAAALAGHILLPVPTA